MIMPDRLINAWNLLQTMWKRKQYQNMQILLANMQVLIMMSHDSLNTRSLRTTYHEIGVLINNLYVAVNVLRNLWITCATKLINFDYSSGAKCFTQWWRSFGINVFVYFNCHFMKDHSTGLKKSYDCRKFYCKSLSLEAAYLFMRSGLRQTTQQTEHNQAPHGLHPWVGQVWNAGHFIINISQTFITEDNNVIQITLSYWSINSEHQHNPQQIVLEYRLSCLNNVKWYLVPFQWNNEFWNLYRMFNIHILQINNYKLIPNHYLLLNIAFLCGKIFH